MNTKLTFVFTTLYNISPINNISIAKKPGRRIRYILSSLIEDKTETSKANTANTIIPAFSSLFVN